MNALFFLGGTLMSLAACDEPFGYGRQTSEPEITENEVIIGDSADPTCDATAPSLVLIGGEGRIEVLHTGLLDACCIVAAAEADDTARRLTVEYQTADTACTCDVCILSYAVSRLAAGEWRVTAGEDSGTVTVE